MENRGGLPGVRVRTGGVSVRRSTLPSRSGTFRAARNRAPPTAAAVPPLAPTRISPWIAKRFALRTYGCQMNVHDSEKVATLLAESGLEPVPSEADADVLVINTCSIRDKAEHQLYSDLGKLRAWKAEKSRAPRRRRRLRRAAGRATACSVASPRSTSSSVPTTCAGCRRLLEGALRGAPRGLGRGGQDAGPLRSADAGGRS